MLGRGESRLIGALSVLPLQGNPVYYVPQSRQSRYSYGILPKFLLKVNRDKFYPI